MKQVIVGGVEQSSISIISKYLETVYTNLEFKILTEQGIAGIVSRGITNPDVVLIVLASDTHTNLKTRVKTLSHAKVYKYTTDEALEEYCSKMVGLEVKSDSFSKPVLPDEDIDLPKLQGVVEDSPIEIQEFSSNSDYDEIISRLNDENAQKDMLIRNLEQQLREIDSVSADDEKELIAEIKRLNAEIDDLKSKASSSTELDYSAKAKIEFAEKKIAELNELKTKVDTYELQISTFKAQVKDLSDENSSLSSQINDYVDEISDLTNNVTALGKQIEAKDLELNAKLAELDLLQSKIDSLNETKSSVETLNSKIANLELDLSNKELDIQNRDSDIEVIKRILAEEQEKYKLLSDEKELLVLELGEKNEKITKLDSELSVVSSSNESLSKKVTDLEAEVLAKSEENELIKEKISELRGKANSNAEISEELRKALEEQEEALHKKEEEFKVKSEEFERQKADFETLTMESSSNQVVIDRLVADKQSLEDKIVEITELNLGLDTKVKALESDNLEKDTKIQGYLVNIQDLETEKSKNTNTINSLQAQLASSKMSNERIVALENELLEERRKSSNLASELNVMKKIDDSGKVADLRVEVAQLKHKLNEVSSNEEDLRRYKQRCTDLELQLAEAEVKGKSTGVFAQMSNIALPKLAYDCKLDEVTGLANNFICIASGSSESTSPVYQLIRKTCQKYRDKRCLILDLSTDSYIDREFSPEKVNSPVDWLLGSQPFTNFVSNTKFSNVKVISTGLAYLNDLCFLKTDWQNRLSELQGFADVVIIYIGCLNNIVSKVLFNTFNPCMRSFVITKATPINLRTVILALTGLVNLNHSLTTVGCVNFDANTSKGLYQKLASKYNAQIYSETDVITL